jgi:hypothetical protein
MRDVHDRTKFYETYFHPQVSWESVTELFNTKIYYVERSDVITNKKPPEGKRKGAINDHGNPIQGGMFDS